jgi:hypothetical protein
MTRTVDIFQSLRSAESAARWARPPEATGFGTHTGNATIVARLGSVDATKPRAVVDVV